MTSSITPNSTPISPAKVVPSEVEVSPQAYKAIELRANNHLLVAPEKIVGPIQRGADRKKHGVAIFRGVAGATRATPLPSASPGHPAVRRPPPRTTGARGG